MALRRFEVECWIGTVRVTVEAGTSDEALTAGIERLAEDDSLLEGATWSVREIESVEE